MQKFLIFILVVLSISSYSFVFYQFGNSDNCSRFLNSRIGVRGQYKIQQVRHLDETRREIILHPHNYLLGRNLVLFTDEDLKGYSRGDYIDLTFDKIDRLSDLDPQFRLYLRSKNICGVLQSGHTDIFESQLDSINSNKFGRIEMLLKRFRSQLFSGYSNSVESLFKAIFIGDTSGFNKELSDQFQVLGISHMVAVSGGNISALALLLTNLIKEKRFKPIVWGVVWIYLFLVGLENLPALRAGVFFQVHSSLKYLGVRYPQWIEFLIAVVSIAILSPMSLFSLSYQLSMVAYLIVRIILMPILDKYFSDSFMWTEIASGFIGTALILPVTLMFFGSVNLVSVIANLVYAPVFNLLFFVAIVLVFKIVDLFAPLVYLLENASVLLFLSFEWFSHYVVNIEASQNLKFVSLSLIYIVVYVLFLVKFIRKSSYAATIQRFWV